MALVKIHIHGFDEILAEIKKQGDRIVATINDAITDLNTKLTASYQAINTNLDGINADVANLKTQIANLQASIGNVTPEQQAILDALVAGASSIADRSKAIDDQTP